MCELTKIFRFIYAVFLLFIMRLTKKWIWIIGLSCLGGIGGFFFYKWFKFNNAIRYAIAPTSVIAITGNDYETTLKRLHNLSLVSALENDGSVEVLYPNDFLKQELAHTPALKKLFRNRKHILSFKAGTRNQLQSLLAVEAGRDTYDSLMQDIIMQDYTVSRYRAPSGEIIEAYNSQKQKELVLCYVYGVIVISSETLFAEETLNSIAGHVSLFKKAELNFSANFIYIKETAMRTWVDEVTKNHTSEFYKWFESIEEAEFKLNEEGSMAVAALYFNDKQEQKINPLKSAFLLENWIQNLTGNYIAFHPQAAKAEIELSEIYRCYTNLQDENISNNTFIIGLSKSDSNVLQAIFSKHAIDEYILLEKHKIYKFGKHPFFKNFCNGATPDLPETFITIVDKNIFLVTSSVATMIPLLQKLAYVKPQIKDVQSGIFVMQVQPQNLLPYFGNIIRDKYRSNILQSSFLQNLDFIQYRLDTIVKDKGLGTVLFNKTAMANNSTAELLWSKILEQETSQVIVIKTKVEGENYILYQDNKNVLHCIDFSSHEIWQKFILGRISSKIFNTDLYRNNENQFFFNTSNQIYAIDNKGSDLSNFPKQINNEELAGMYLFDMGDNYEYFFVDDNKIYGYDAGGASLEDWRPRESPVAVHSELLQYKKRNKNYLIGINRNGELYIWNRFGKRVERELDFSKPVNTGFFITKAINKRYRAELINVNEEPHTSSLYLDSLQTKRYKSPLKRSAVYFITQNMDSAFQKIVYQTEERLFLFDRFSQLTDSVKIARDYKLKKVFDIDERQSFMVVSNGSLSKIISSRSRIVADKIEGEIVGIIADEIPNHYFAISFDQLKRVNLYKFSL